MSSRLRFDYSPESYSAAHGHTRLDSRRLPGRRVLGSCRREGPHGCLANTLVGILGGLLGGWFATEELHMDSSHGFLGALLVSFLGAVVIRLILDALESGDRRDRRRGPWA